MKSRKVQAQRKFAQGAYVPPHHNNNLPARIDHNVTPTKEDRNIVHHNLAAKNLLDIVSFQSMHPHAEPRVLLQRLSKKETMAQNGHSPSPSEPDEPVTIPSTHTSPIEKNASEKQKMETKILPKKKITFAPITYKTRGAKDHKLLAKRRNSTAVRPTRKRVLERQGSSSDIDDDTAKRRNLTAVRPTRKEVSERQGSSSDIDDETSKRRNSKAARPTRKGVSERQGSCSDIDDETSKRRNLTAVRPTRKEVSERQGSSSDIDDETSKRRNSKAVRPTRKGVSERQGSSSDIDDETSKRRNLTTVRPTRKGVSERQGSSSDIDDETSKRRNSTAVRPTRKGVSERQGSSSDIDDETSKRRNLTAVRPTRKEVSERQGSSSDIDDETSKRRNSKAVRPTRKGVSERQGSSSDIDDETSKRRNLTAVRPTRKEVSERQGSSSDIDDEKSNRRNLTAVRPTRKTVLDRQGSSSDFDDETPLSLAKLRKENNTHFKDTKPEENATVTKTDSKVEIPVKTRNKTDKDAVILSSPEKSSPEKPVKKLKNKKLRAKSSLKRIAQAKSKDRSGMITRSWRGNRKFKLRSISMKNQGKIDKFVTITPKTLGGSHNVAKFKNNTVLKKKKIVSQKSDKQAVTSPKTTTIDTSKEPTEEKAEKPSTNQHVYLDLLPRDSPHVIQLTTDKTQNQNKRMMRARLIPKSQANTTQDLTLVENEPILGPILQTFKFEKKDDVVDISDDSSCDVIIRKEESSKSSSFLHSLDKVKAREAPTYYPTEKEFDDPIAYFKKIAPHAAKFGVCKIVPPPSYKSNCVLEDEINFHVTNQYIGRLYSRWGPAMREMCAIKANLASQNVTFRAPLLDHLELNLPKLHRLVQRNGGLSNVLEMKQWNRVADEMRIYKTGHQCLDRICMKTLLPYDTLSSQERQQLLAKVEKGWNRKNQKLLEWAINPLHRQKKLLGESDSSGEETEEDPNVTIALKEAEDCIVKGRNMNLTTFKKVANNAKESYLGKGKRTCAEIEEEYWRIVLLGTDHICVNTASIDTGKNGYGFPRSKTDPQAKHPWNLKMVSQSSGNVLRSLGMVLGATVPTLHLGMVFSTSCWHRDPHGLPWLEYMHSGPPKIWYGIPNEQSANFRKAVETLCPTSCQNKSIWLPSDITMIPPELLRTHGVALARVEQNPGEYIMVFPKAYSCSISTGYTVSESVYFATDSWLKDVDKVFQELRESCEPTTFSLEQLLMSLALDARSRVPTLLLVRDTLAGLVAQETCHRKQLQARGLSVVQESRTSKQRGATDAWNGQEECEVCRTTLYWSKVTFLKGRRSAVCLKHALRLLDTPRLRDCDVSDIQLVTMFPLKQLEQSVQSLITATT